MENLSLFTLLLVLLMLQIDGDIVVLVLLMLQIDGDIVVGAVIASD